MATRVPASIEGTRRWAMIFLPIAILMSMAPLHAQQEEPRGGNVATQVSDLIVHIEAFKPRREDGAGIVVGTDADWVYIATARHVVTLVRDPSIPADSVRVEFEAGRVFIPAEIDTIAVEANLDVAVIRVSRAAAVDAGFRPVLDRLGDSENLGPGSEVRPVGCPGSNCWRAPSPPDRVLFASPVEILFQTTFVRGGSSGGGIFNRWDEVVGMVQRVEPPGAYAMPMDLVLEIIEAWGRPVSIRKPPIPRRGYLTSIGFSLMAPTSGTILPEGRLPSGRLMFTVGIREPLDISLGVHRMAPGDLGTACPPPARQGEDPLTTVISLRDRAPCEAVVNAFMVGLGARLQTGRLVVRPFAEGGVGRVRARYDIGGVYEFTDLKYLPNFKAVEQTGFGGGAGATLDYIVVPHMVIQGIAGYWRFQDPFEGAELPAGYAPKIPSVYVGIGLRWGI